MSQQSLPLQEETQDLTLDDLNPMWITSDGLPLFLADRDDICDAVESFGFSIYYLLAHQDKEIKPSTSTSSNNKTPQTQSPPVIVRSSQIYRVVNNFVGHSITAVSPEFYSDIISFKEEAVYTMPPIPHVLVDKLDQFFRLVDAQHGTESIVMLTYDVTKDGSDGWGILVPDQTNTSVHCNYDPDSIARIKPDDVMIVGSVHSHPGMSAYASGTDHADQADFDGIHITFGWQKSVNNGATQYYAEMQMAGKSYKLDIEDVFEDYLLEKAPDPEVVGWTDKVKKVLPPSTGGTQVLPPNQAQSSITGTKQPGSTPTTTAAGPNLYPLNHIEYSSYILDIIEEVIPYSQVPLLVCEAIDSFEKDTHFNCPSCFSRVSASSVYIDNCCSICDVPLCEPDTPVDQLVYNMISYCEKRNITQDCILYLLAKDVQSNFMVLRITPDLISTYDTYSPSFEESRKSKDNLTLCCSQQFQDCYCPVQVIESDSFDFDNFMGTHEVYDPSSNCLSCEHYYSTSCPRYTSLVVSFKKNSKNKQPEEYSNTINSDNCTSYVDMLYNESTYGYY